MSSIKPSLPSNIRHQTNFINIVLLVLAVTLTFMLLAEFSQLQPVTTPNTTLTAQPKMAMLTPANTNSDSH